VSFFSVMNVILIRVQNIFFIKIVIIDYSGVGLVHHGGRWGTESCGVAVKPEAAVGQDGLKNPLDPAQLPAGLLQQARDMPGQPTGPLQFGQRLPDVGRPRGVRTEVAGPLPPILTPAELVVGPARRADAAWAKVGRHKALGGQGLAFRGAKTQRVQRVGRWVR
jgi:hypothetical protein